MLSDEENKEYIEHEILDRLYCLEENDFDKNKVDDGYIQAVLNACKEAKNLIEKQSKEIERLNNKFEKIYNEIDNKNSQLVKALNYKLFIEDKIKAKIEELDKMKSNGKYTILFNSDNVMEVVKAVLQSLLEKET